MAFIKRYSTITGSQRAEDIIFKDVLQSDLTFVPNSVVIDNISYPGLNPNLGFGLTNLDSGDSHTVKFQAIIN